MRIVNDPDYPLHAHLIQVRGSLTANAQDSICNDVSRIGVKPRCIASAADVPPEGPQKPDLARVPLQAGALQALQAKLKAYAAAKQQSLLAEADSINSTAKAASSDEQLNQQYQVSEAM